MISKSAAGPGAGTSRVGRSMGLLFGAFGDPARSQGPRCLCPDDVRCGLRGNELGRDTVEHAVQLGAESAGAQDDGDADQGGDEAVLDGRRAGLVLGKAVHKGLHDGTPTVRPKICGDRFPRPVISSIHVLF